MKIKAGDTIANYAIAKLDGVDVTDRCTEADSLCGYVDVLVMPNGRPVLVDGEPLKERKFGTVEIMLRDDAPDTARHAYEYMRAVDGLTPLARSFAELAAYAEKLTAGLREFRELALKHGVVLEDVGLYGEGKAADVPH